MQIPRSLRASAIALAAASLFSQPGCDLPDVDPSSYYLSAPLLPLVPVGGGGRVEILMSARQRSFFIALEGLPPDADYTVTVAGEPFITLSTDAAGHGEANASIDERRFDPRGQRIAVVDSDGTEMLELAGPAHRAYVETEVAPLAAFAPGGGAVQTTTRGGVQSMSVLLYDAEPGVYDLVVDLVPRATLDASSGRALMVLAPPGFDPRTASLELQRDGIGYFAGSGRANIEGLDWCSPDDAGQAFVSLESGIGRASLATRIDCTRRFEVEIAGVPMGDYELLVGGELRGTLGVGEDESGATSGALRFSSTDGGAARLDFEPVGQPIEIRQSAQPYFRIDAFAP